MSSKHTDRFSDRRFLPISGENETRADVTTQTPPTAALSEKDTLFPQSSRSHSDYLLYFHIISSSRFISLCEFVQKETHTHTHRVVHQCGLECQTTGGRGDGALANLSHTHHTTCSPAPETVIGCSSVTPPPPPAARPLLLVSTGGCLEEPRCDFCETRGRRSRLRIRFPARFTRSACNACDGRLFVEADGPNIKK